MLGAIKKGDSPPLRHICKWFVIKYSCSEPCSQPWGCSALIDPPFSLWWLQQELEDHLLPVPVGPYCSHQPGEDEAAPFQGQIHPSGEVLVSEGRVVSDLNDVPVASLCKRPDLRLSKRLVKAEDKSSTVLFKAHYHESKILHRQLLYICSSCCARAHVLPWACLELSNDCVMLGVNAKQVCGSDAAWSRLSFCLHTRIIPSLSLCALVWVRMGELCSLLQGWTWQGGRWGDWRGLGKMCTQAQIWNKHVAFPVQSILSLLFGRLQLCLPWL